MDSGIRHPESRATGQHCIGLMHAGPGRDRSRGLGPSEDEAIRETGRHRPSITQCRGSSIEMVASRAPFIPTHTAVRIPADDNSRASIDYPKG